MSIKGACTCREGARRGKSTIGRQHIITHIMHPSTTGSRVAIVGVGQVGGAAAYAMILTSVADVLLLVDSNADRRDSQVRDLSDAAYASNSRTRVLQGSYREASQCDIVVITAGSRITMGLLWQLDALGATQANPLSRRNSSRILIPEHVYHPVRRERHDTVQGGRHHPRGVESRRHPHDSGPGPVQAPTGAGHRLGHLSRLGAASWTGCG